MGAVTTIAATVAAAAGAVALYRFVDRRTREFRDYLSTRPAPDGGKTLDYERDPESGVFRRKP